LKPWMHCVTAKNGKENNTVTITLASLFVFGAALGYLFGYWYGRSTERKMWLKWWNSVSVRQQAVANGVIVPGLDLWTGREGK